MKQYALWKRISAYSIVIFLVPLLAFVVVYNRYTVETLQERELLRYRQSCEMQVNNINKMFLNIRNFAYDAIYASDTMYYMEAALADPESYVRPTSGVLTVDALMSAQDYASNIMLFTMDGLMYLKAGIAADYQSIADNFLVSDGRQPTESWSNRRFVRQEYPYETYKPCISYYRIITRMKSMETIGYCRIDIPEYSLRAVYSTNDGSTALLIDSDGLIQSTTSDLLAGMNIDSIYDGALSQAIEQGRQVGTVVSIDGVDNYVVCRNVSRIGWTYVSIIPLNILTYYSKYMQTMLVVLTIGCSLIFIAIQTLSARMITKPLQQLAGEMDKICNNDCEHITRVRTSNETQMLRYSFEDMRRRIENMTERVYVAQIEELNAKLMYLQTQMNPHFLYNTLDSIRFSARLHDDKVTAGQIEALSAIYRSLTQDGVCETVAQSLMLTRKFALIMQNQQDMQVVIHERVQPELMDQIIPKLMIQPLVENCYQHGFKGLERDMCNIWLSVTEEDGRIVIEVQDDGVGVDDPEALMESLTSGRCGQLALKNIHARIQLYFGKSHGIRISNRPGGGMVARIELPGREEMDKLR